MIQEWTQTTAASVSYIFCRRISCKKPPRKQRRQRQILKPGAVPSLLNCYPECVHLRHISFQGVKIKFWINVYSGNSRDDISEAVRGKDGEIQCSRSLLWLLLLSFSVLSIKKSEYLFYWVTDIFLNILMRDGAFVYVNVSPIQFSFIFFTVYIV